MVAAVGSGQQFAKGRDLAVSLGLTPKQHTVRAARTGGWGRVKRGAPYLRKLLIHGARSVIHHAKDKDDRLSHWVLSPAARSYINVASVALANKTARIAWAMIQNGSDYPAQLARG